MHNTYNTFIFKGCGYIVLRIDVLFSGIFNKFVCLFNINVVILLFAIVSTYILVHRCHCKLSFT